MRAFDPEVSTVASNFRTILVFTIALSVAVGILYAFAVRYPSLSWYATIASGILGLFGFVVAAFAMIMAFTIATSDDDGNRRSNMAKCLRLAGLGLVALVPITWFALMTVLFD